MASVNPDNVPWLRLIRKLGFTHVGKRWDDDDGWELTFERPVRRA